MIKNIFTHLSQFTRWKNLLEHPTLPILFILETLELRSHMKWISGIDHNGEFVSEFIVIGLHKGLRMGTMINTLRVVGDGTSINIIPREKIPLVIKKNLIIINIG